jgi:hypothetical protein
MKILVGVNTLTSLDHAVYSNHCQFWYRLGKEFPQHQFILNHPKRMSIDHMRNFSAKLALEHGADYLMFIDDDVIIPLDTLKLLLDCKADIAAGWTIIRGYPYDNMFFRYTDDLHTSLGKPKTATLEKNAEGLWDVDAVGFSCVLISCELLKKVQAPYFVTGPFHTEDVYFCLKAEYALKETGEKIKIVVHPEVKTAHCLGNEYIDPDNVQQWREFTELMNEGLKDRADEPTMATAAIPPDGTPTYDQILKDAIFGAE